MRKAEFYHKRDDGKIECGLCPHQCIIGKGKTGICRVRLNRDGDLSLPFYGELSAVCMDPVEKKPLYHFFPGHAILSLGFWGCTFKCPFCQNYQISQTTRSMGRLFLPDQVVRQAFEQRSFGIAYTFSEPLVHYEYLLDTAVLARENGLKNVLISNGYINPEPAMKLLPWLDAANIDLKAFNSDFYQREIGGSLEEVKRFLEQVSRQVHLEVTTLVIPGKNDSEKDIDALAGFLAGLNPDIPYHLSCYYPTYKYTVPATEPGQVAHLAKVAARHLRYVYLGNAGLQESNTCCPVCHHLLVRRSGYRITIEGLGRNGNNMQHPSLPVCTNCHTPVPILGIA